MLYTGDGDSSKPPMLTTLSCSDLYDIIYYYYNIYIRSGGEE